MACRFRCLYLVLFPETDLSCEEKAEVTLLIMQTRNNRIFILIISAKDSLDRRESRFVSSSQRPCNNNRIISISIIPDAERILVRRLFRDATGTSMRDFLRHA